MVATVFIDGEAGTTGLGISERLRAVDGITVKSIAPEHRKDPAARKAMMADVDAVVLCLPDDAARETTALAASLGNDAPRLLDASTAHRTAPDWVYGFAELDAGQSDRIRGAAKVSNPGCYPTGGIALLRPLIASGVMAADFPVTINAVSGYSGGGKAMIAAHESHHAPSFEMYGLTLEHKHLAEVQTYSGLTRRPIFVPSVGNFRQGMLVSVPLHLDLLTGSVTPKQIEDVFVAYYANSTLVKVIPSSDASVTSGKIEPEALNDTDMLELRVYGNAARGQAVLVARLDNLGKGASGAAVQNLKLMLGVD